MPYPKWMNESHNIVDIIHGVIPYNGLEAKIIESTIFSRLHRIFQSSLAYLTFPSNKVHRHEHSMGVMHLSGMFFFHSICNSRPEEIKTLLDEVYAELKVWLDGADAVNYLKSSAVSDLQQDKDAYLRPKDDKKITYPDCALYRQHNLRVRSVGGLATRHRAFAIQPHHRICAPTTLSRRKILVW